VEEPRVCKGTRGRSDLSCAQDHAKKTVTIDPHPHIAGVAHASIHPCKHSATLKKIIDQMESGDGPEMRVS
jgi:ubiquitin-like-conjugating enzyme ATG3